MADEPGALTKVQQNLIGNLLRVGINGFGPFKSATEMAQDALEKAATPAEAVKHLIRTHVTAAGVQGFATNVGGLITLPVSLPANVAAATLVQAHLIASIAAVHGHDLESDEVQTAIMVCMLGNAGTDVLKKAGIRAGSNLTMALIKKIPEQLIKEINKRIGFTLLAKYGTSRATVTLAKGVPLVGGVIGGTFDAVTTRAVGAFAARFFTADDDQPPNVVEGTFIDGEVVDVTTD
ncbi:EcsC family protein [Saccharothrix longispora]|uniref:EcsC family protein n=1 Tax=Saccharothrix longispora TaxID=33920 RepID=UPI0028FD4A35|nr:EcsC family protein [Saccharothrix longispora]MBY8851107.1 EcsC family protein [Saccharothrix sp. MB29]MDU0291131.1 EcsC family protein [Saccharothrix longispora]